jgi:hypothetical protein
MSQSWHVSDREATDEIRTEERIKGNKVMFIQERIEAVNIIGSCNSFKKRRERMKIGHKRTADYGLRKVCI